MRYELGRGGLLLRDGERIGLVHRSWWRQRAEVTVASEHWLFRATGRERLALDAGSGRVLVRARRTGFWSVAWVIEGEAGRYDFRSGGAFSRKLVVERAGAAVGDVVPATFWSHRQALELYQEVPVIDAVFLLWLGFTVRAAQSAAAAGGG